MDPRGPDRDRRGLAGVDRACRRTTHPPARARPLARARDRQLHSRPPRPHSRGARGADRMKSRGVEPPQFRQLLGRFATGITVLTSRSPDGDPIGMTANSLASVSLQPPLVLVAVAKGHEMHTAMEKGTHYVSNIPSSEQDAMSRRFAA